MAVRETVTLLIALVSWSHAKDVYYFKATDPNLQGLDCADHVEDNGCTTLAPEICSDIAAPYVCAMTCGYCVLDHCATYQPCANGGKCHNIDNGYECRCAAGFIGTNCKVQDPCKYSPCQNGGTCSVTGTNFKCTCPEKFTGLMCNRVKDPCLSNPCQNGGACSSNNDIVRCTCTAGYVGKFCQTAMGCADPYVKMADLGCHGKQDIVILMEVSSADNKDTITREIHMIKDIIADKNFHLRRGQTQVAVVLFNDKVHEIIGLTDDVNAIHRKLDEAARSWSHGGGGHSYLAHALDHVRIYSLAPGQQGVRHDSRKSVLAIVHGTDRPDALRVPEATKDLHDSCISLNVIYVHDDSHHYHNHGGHGRTDPNERSAFFTLMRSLRAYVQPMDHYRHYNTARGLETEGEKFFDDDDRCDDD